jgi:LPS-assembly protein
MTDSTEYNRFSFNFENDCIIGSLTYSKDFYSDKDLKNTKTLIFGITIKPFADSLGPDLTEFIN